MAIRISHILEAKHKGVPGLPGMRSVYWDHIKEAQARLSESDSSLSKTRVLELAREEWGPKVLNRFKVQNPLIIDPLCEIVSHVSHWIWKIPVCGTAVKYLEIKVENASSKDRQHEKPLTIGAQQTPACACKEAEEATQRACRGWSPQPPTDCQWGSGWKQWKWLWGKRWWGSGGKQWKQSCHWFWGQWSWGSEWKQWKRSCHWVWGQRCRLT